MTDSKPNTTRIGFSQVRGHWKILRVQLNLMPLATPALATTAMATTVKINRSLKRFPNHSPSRPRCLDIAGVGASLTAFTMPESTILEIVADDQKEFAAVAQQNGLLPETTQNLQSSFAPLFTQARSILEKSRAIVVTDANQKLEIELAGTYRKALKAVRVTSEKTRKELKEESVKKGRAIDGFHNILLHLVEGEETRLDEQEKFAERQAAERKAALKTQREELLKPYGIDLLGYSLGEMTEITFDQLLSGTKLAHEAKIEAARKAEAERIAAEAAAVAEQARIKAENERLKKEAEEKEAALAAERAKLEAKANEERLAKEKLEAEAARIQKALAAERETERENARKAAAAPDKEKLRAFAESLWDIKLPELTSDGGKAVLAALTAQHEKYIAWVTKQGESL